MKNSFVKTAAAIALATGAVGAQALVLDFDDLSGFAYFTSDYVKDGVAFKFGNNLAATNDWLFDDVPNPFNLPVSGTWIGTSCGGPFPACGQSIVRDSLPITSATPFQLNSVYLSGSDPLLGPMDELVPLVLTFKLYDSVASVVPVHTQIFVLPTDGVAMPYTLNYNGLINKFVVNGVQAYYAMDNIDVTPVPEPGTYALMVAGMALVGAAVRRRKADQA